ncbi:hypothetical protein [Tenacibaculum phage JQ]|nr:hypothetical protein [Tenacibaculum phage JQ]
MKICNYCKEEKENKYFGKDKRNKDGLQGTCRKCCNEKRTERYKNNEAYRNKCKQRIKKYNKKANERAKKHVEQLTDFYLIASLKRGTNLTTEDIKQHPELIQAKKQIILNQRLCRELKTSKN